MGCSCFLSLEHKAVFIPSVACDIIFVHIEQGISFAFSETVDKKIIGLEICIPIPICNYSIMQSSPLGHKCHPSNILTVRDVVSKDLSTSWFCNLLGHSKLITWYYEDPVILYSIPEGLKWKNVLKPTVAVVISVFCCFEMCACAWGGGKYFSMKIPL